MTRLAARPAAVPALVGALALAAWLFLAVMPAAADGGPHIASENAGVTSLTSDSCAGCHRVHTAQGAMLLKVAEESLCASCHGASGLGATTDVEGGLQYGLGSGDVRGGTVAGALRSGGFVEAQIGSDDPTRISYPRSFLGAAITMQSTEVRVRAAPQQVTSAHIAFDGTGITSNDVAWGNGGLNSGPGPAFTTTCTSCHNPHGNGNYRILVPVPSDGTGPLVEAASVNVSDAALPVGTDAAGTRNYTVKWGRTLADVVDETYPGGGTGETGGDYWRDWLPWDGVPGWNGSSVTPPSGVEGDRPMYVPGGTNLNGFRGQITAWCAACHTRYSGVTGASNDSGDDLFTYKHDVGLSECTQCHVAHGSNADMPGRYSSTFTYPNDAVSASSRLLKIDNRGTCQACHDPTHSVPFTNVITDPTP